MTTLTWYRDAIKDVTHVHVGGWAHLAVNLRDFDDEARRRFPILAPEPRLAREHMEQAWMRENIAPLVWLGMPVHDSPRQNQEERP